LFFCDAQFDARFNASGRVVKKVCLCRRGFFSYRWFVIVDRCFAGFRIQSGGQLRGRERLHVDLVAERRRQGLQFVIRWNQLGAAITAEVFPGGVAGRESIVRCSM
jgi:hypothetical protein